MRVSREVLLAIAGIVWLLAGINIVVIGIRSYIEYAQLLAAGDAQIPLPALIIGSVAVFCAFWFGVFSRILRKHTVRIMGYGDEKKPVWLFFDKASYIVMAFMMTLGISLRVFHLAPVWFIASFYVGLGAALTLAGIGFGLNAIRAKNNPHVPVTSETTRMFTP